MPGSPHMSTTGRRGHRRIELDARVEGADGLGLTALCLERALGEIARAQYAHQRGERARRIDALTRAAAALTGLERGVSADNPLSQPLRQLYGSAAHALRAGLIDYRADVVERVRTDLAGIAALLPQ
jgi:flagellin-specific chaperone FliS